MTRILANQKEPNTEISPTNDVTAEERGTDKEETEFTRIQELETNKKRQKFARKKKKFTSSTTETRRKAGIRKGKKPTPESKAAEQDREQTIADKN